MLLGDRTIKFLTRISAKVVYGTIILATVIGTISDPLPNNLRVVVTVFLSLYAVSIANSYAKSIDNDMARRQVTPWRDKIGILLQPGWIVASSVFPVAFFGFALAGIISQDVALRTTKWALVVLLLFFGTVARRLSGAALLPSLFAGVGAAALGYFVVQLKLWTKYLPVLGS